MTAFGGSSSLDLEDRYKVRLFTRLFLVAFVVFVVMTYYAYTEARYMVFGVKTTGTVIEVNEAPLIGPRARVVVYEYKTDSGETRRGKWAVANIKKLKDPPETDDDIDVVYIPGATAESMVDPERKRWAVPVYIIVVGGTLAAGSAYFWSTLTPEMKADLLGKKEEAM